MIDASRGSELTMDRAYLNKDKGSVCCCWNAPSREAVEELFKKANVPYEEITEVTEYSQTSF